MNDLEKRTLKCLKEITELRALKVYFKDKSVNMCGIRYTFENEKFEYIAQTIMGIHHEIDPPKTWEITKKTIEQVERI